MNTGLCSETEWPIPEILRAVVSPLPFAWLQHVVNPSLAQNVSSQSDDQQSFKQLFFMGLMTQAWYGTKTKFHVTAFPSQGFTTRPSLTAFLARIIVVFTGSEQFVHSCRRASGHGNCLLHETAPLTRRTPEGAMPSEPPFKQTYLGLLEQLGVSSLEDKCCLWSAIFN